MAQKQLQDETINIHVFVIWYGLYQRFDCTNVDGSYGYRTDVVITKDTPYLSLMGDLWGTVRICVIRNRTVIMLLLTVMSIKISKYISQDLVGYFDGNEWKISPNWTRYNGRDDLCW